MAFYKPVKATKAASSFLDYKKDSNVVMEADIQLYPDPKYKAGATYRCSGLGSIFDGTYNLTTVTHVINREGYSVNAKGTKTLVKYTPPSKNTKPATATTKTKKEITHRVIKDDTLWDILEKYGRNPLKYNELAKYNNIRNPHLIYPGQVVRIPASI